MKDKNSIPAAIVIAGIILAGAIVFSSSSDGGYISRKTGKAPATGSHPAEYVSISPLEKLVMPEEGLELPVKWDDLGLRLASTGVIDVKKLQAIYAEREGMPEEFEKLLLYQNDGNLRITRENAGFLLNLFWALGLANANPLLGEEMADPKYGGVGVFASTAGWTVGRGDPMDHYGMHRFVELTPEQQTLVAKMARGIYRPCCNNSTHFPDCNHGMAMLGLLELMAYQGASEQDMWRAALAVNSFWFPDTYMNIAIYMEGRGVSWKDVPSNEILGAEFSSASGYGRLISRIKNPYQPQGGNGCGVSSGSSAPQKQDQGCGV